jgi:hypothetical protein
MHLAFSINNSSKRSNFSFCSKIFFVDQFQLISCARIQSSNFLSMKIPWSVCIIRIIARSLNFIRLSGLYTFGVTGVNLIRKDVASTHTHKSSCMIVLFSFLFKSIFFSHKHYYIVISFYLLPFLTPFAFINQTKTDCTVLSQSWSFFEAFEVLYFFKF